MRTARHSLRTLSDRRDSSRSMSVAESRATSTVSKCQRPTRTGRTCHRVIEVDYHDLPGIGLVPRSWLGGPGVEHPAGRAHLGQRVTVAEGGVMEPAVGQSLLEIGEADHPLVDPVDGEDLVDHAVTHEDTTNALGGGARS